MKRKGLTAPLDVLKSSVQALEAEGKGVFSWLACMP